MNAQSRPRGRRERAKVDKHRRILDAARSLFADDGVTGVTTQQIADRADVAIGTLYLYASTKAELLIMVQNEKFAAAIVDGLAAVEATPGSAVAERVMALVTPVVACIREHPENGRTYLHELVFGDPAEPHRAEGLALAWQLEAGLTDALAHDPRIGDDAATLARVITAVLHVTATASIFLDETPDAILGHIERQISAILCRP